MAQTFSLLPVFRPVLSKGASKAKIVWHLVAINFGYVYFCFVTYFSEIFLVNIFFSKLFFQNFSEIFCVKIFFSKLFFPNFSFQIFSSQFFFQLFSKIFFWGLYSRCLSVYGDKTDSMYLCYEKSRVAGATRDKYITYRTDTDRSAVYVSRLTATHCSYTRHNFLIHRGLKSQNLFVFPDFNQLASWRIRIILYFLFFFLFQSRLALML